MACKVQDLFKDQDALANLQSVILDQYGENINVPPLPADIAQKFAYQSNATLKSIDLVEETPTYNRYQGVLEAQDQAHVRKFPSRLSDDAGIYIIKFDFFATKKPAQYVMAPLVIQLPPLGSSGAIEKLVGQYFANEGAHSLAVYTDHNAVSQDQPIDQLNQFNIRNTVAVQQALDFLLATSATHFQRFQGLFPNLVPAPIDATSIFSFGISLGGIRNTYLIAAEPRIRKGLIIMGGGNIPSVMTQSKEPNVVDYRRYWTNRLWAEGKIPFATSPAYEQYLKELITLDPLDLAPYIASRRVSMVVSQNDNVVPTAHQISLWERLGKPAMAKVEFTYYDLLNLPANTTIPTGHFDLYFAQTKVLEYAKEQFLISKSF